MIIRSYSTIHVRRDLFLLLTCANDAATVLICKFRCILMSQAKTVLTDKSRRIENIKFPTKFFRSSLYLVQRSCTQKYVIFLRYILNAIILQENKNRWMVLFWAGDSLMFSNPEYAKISRTDHPEIGLNQFLFHYTFI